MNVSFIVKLKYLKGSSVRFADQQVQARLSDHLSPTGSNGE
jgi:hypothetical protein